MKISDLNYKDKYCLYGVHNKRNYGLSNSLVDTYDTCPMKFFLTINCIELRNYVNTTTAFGDIIHDYLKQYYTQGYLSFPRVYRRLTEKNYDENLIGRVYGTLRAYVKLDKYQRNKYEVIDVEYERETKINDVPVRCKIDLKLRSKKNNCVFLVDHKTTQIFNEVRIASLIDKLKIDQQTGLYISTDDCKITDLDYNIIKNPASCRIRKNEDVLQFTKRIEDTILKNPEGSLDKLKLSYNRTDKVKFINRFSKKIDNIKEMFNTLYDEGVESIEKRTINCLTQFNKSCKFLPVCAYDKVNTLHYKIGNTVMKQYTNNKI